MPNVFKPQPTSHTRPSGAHRDNAGCARRRLRRMAQSASAKIDAKIADLGDCRGKTLARASDYSCVRPGDRRGVEVDGHASLFARRAIDIREGEEIAAAA